MTLDPQRTAGPYHWISAHGRIPISEMLDEHLLNAFKTCLRHNNPKADELEEEIEYRGLTHPI